MTLEDDVQQAAQQSSLRQAAAEREERRLRVELMKLGAEFAICCAERGISPQPVLGVRRVPATRSWFSGVEKKLAHDEVSESIGAGWKFRLFSESVFSGEYVVLEDGRIIEHFSRVDGGGNRRRLAVPRQYRRHATPDDQFLFSEGRDMRLDGSKLVEIRASLVRFLNEFDARL